MVLTAGEIKYCCVFICHDAAAESWKHPPPRESSANSNKAGPVYPDAAQILRSTHVRPSSLRHSPTEPTHEEAGAVAQEVSERICDDRRGVSLIHQCVASL